MSAHRILVVDDESDLVEMLAVRLRGAGYDVACECDPERGLALARTYKPDAILLDVSMPGMDGWEFCRRLRQRAAPPPVMIMTAWLTEDLRARADAVGAARVVLKPFDEKQVVAAVGVLAEGTV